MSNPWIAEPTKTAGGSEYFRLKDLKDFPGKSADIRILCPFITGYEGWTEEGRPIRSEHENGFPADTVWRVENGQQSGPRQFWATAVWNHRAGRIQVWSFTQRTIHSQLSALASNPKWGAMNEYDITLSRTGEGTKTEYKVVPNPKEPLPPDAMIAWVELQEKWLGLPALYHNGHPMQDFSKSAF